MFRKKITDNWFPGGVVERIVEGLIETSVLTKKHNFFKNQIEERYCLRDVEYARFLVDNNLIENLLFGFEYIIEKYTDSVFLIENIDHNNDINPGTGFLIKDNDAYYVVTNKHVVEKSKKIKLFLSSKSIAFRQIIESIDYDLAFIEVNLMKGEAFYLSESIKILSEIITMGFPSIPGVHKNTVVCHKGEVNSFVEDYKYQEYFLISAKTSSGNSGSPVIDKHGAVIGIISRELYEKEAFKEKGKLPYYSSIPSKTILSELIKLKKTL